MQTIRTFLAKTPLTVRIVLLYAVLIGTIGASSVAVQNAQPVIAYSESNPPVLVEQAQAIARRTVVERALPTQLSVASVGIDLKVLPGTYNTATKEWTLDSTHAFFATQSSLPGTVPGTTFIYGHNRASAFAPLAQLETGDTVELTLESGAKLTYQYARDTRVSPESTNVMYEKSTYPQLILMTCDGLFSEVRRIMYFTLKEVA